MTQYLLAAEADQIQDFIFRAAHLREVVGGSQLLTRFSREIPTQLLGIPLTDPRLVVNDGGAFRILLDDPQKARDFGAALAEAYRLSVDGALTVIDKPVEVNEPLETGFRIASKWAEEELRQAKRRGRAGAATPQLPHIAFCASCGVGIAIAHAERLTVPDERPQYLCYACRVKGRERAEHRIGDFLKPFLEHLGNPDKLDWPGNPRGGKEPDPTEDVAAYDPRGRYVAYLLADVNNMGKIFSQCNQKQMKTLSEGMAHVLRAALAAPTEQIMRKPGPQGKNFVPTLPLIIGGDDLFALIPAPWAIDFAREFCAAFRNEMENLFKDPVFKGSFTPPTIAAAVVICKSNYPFSLAHQTGEELLDEAKRLAKSENQSAVNFTVIRGSHVGGELEKGDVRPTLRPYWVYADVAPKGLKVERLREQRARLDKLPGKRQAELRALYDDHPFTDDKKEWAAWTQRLDRLLTRIGRDAEIGDAVKQAIGELGSGDKKVGYWCWVDRVQDEKKWLGHGLPDLLDLWDYARKLGEEA